MILEQCDANQEQPIPVAASIILPLTAAGTTKIKSTGRSAVDLKFARFVSPNSVDLNSTESQKQTNYDGILIDTLIKAMFWYRNAAFPPEWINALFLRHLAEFIDASHPLTLWAEPKPIIRKLILPLGFNDYSITDAFDYYTMHFPLNARMLRSRAPRGKVMSDAERSRSRIRGIIKCMPSIRRNVLVTDAET